MNLISSDFMQCWRFENLKIEMKVSHSTVNCHSVHGVHTYLGESYGYYYTDPTNNHNIFTDVEHFNFAEPFTLGHRGCKCYFADFM